MRVKQSEDERRLFFKALKEKALSKAHPKEIRDLFFPLNFSITELMKKTCAVQVRSQSAVWGGDSCTVRRKVRWWEKDVAETSDARVGFFSNPRVPLLWNYLARPSPPRTTVSIFPTRPAPHRRPLNRHTRHCNVNENSLYFSLKVLGNIAL